MKTVFLAIPAYRDPDLIPTIESALHAPGAKVRVGVVWQGNGDMRRKLAQIPEVDLIAMPHTSARGTYWPRAILGTMIEDEDFICYVDSHMRFFDGWARRLIEQSDMLPARSVLSTYPMKFGSTERWVPVMQLHAWGPKYPQFRAQPLLTQLLSRPLKARIVAAGFVWGPRQWALECPWDPRYYHGFGEFAMAVQSWTRGFDLWHPSVPVLTHDYADNPRHWRDHEGWAARYSVGRQRYESLLSGNLRGIYGIGGERSIEDFQQWAGMDLEAREFVTDCEWRHGIKPRGNYSQDELAALAEATERAVSGDGCHQLVEIGSHTGSSATAIGLAVKRRSPGSLLWCIDPHEGVMTGANNPDGTKPRPRTAPSLGRFREVVERYGLPVREVVARSDEVEWTAGPISLIHFDGDHTRDGVRGDWERFSPHLEPWATVVFHDYNKWYPGVTELVDRLQAEGAIVEDRVVGSAWIGRVNRA